MQNHNNATTNNNLSEPTIPFVNEECGDTMWDEVLAQEEENAN
jgi:hypothetical protein